MSLYDCDLCGKHRACERCWVFGIETFACAECRGDEEEPTAGQPEALDIPPKLVGHPDMKAGQS